jgi:catechol 2,3-dioxygenase-like lactoylglutathione lyase family enzyme
LPAESAKPTTAPAVPDGLISHLIHTCIVCSDFDRSLDFYTRVLGASIGGRVSQGEAGPMLAAMGAPGRTNWRGAMLYWGDPRRTSLIDLISYDEGSEGAAKAPARSATDLGFSRLCLRVTDIEKATEHLRENDVILVSEPIDLMIEGRLHHILFFLDPDGTLLEFSERTGRPHGRR